jgi:hypothetical protein
MDARGTPSGRRKPMTTDLKCRLRRRRSAQLPTVGSSIGGTGWSTRRPSAGLHTSRPDRGPRRATSDRTPPDHQPDGLACRAAPVQPSFTTALAPPAGGAHVHEAPRQAPTVSPSVQPVPAPAAGALAHLPHDPHPSSGERAQDGRHEQEDCQYPQQQSPDVHGCRGLSSNRTASGVREPARAELSPLSVPMPVASAWQGCGGGGWRPTIRR